MTGSAPRSRDAHQQLRGFEHKPNRKPHIRITDKRRAKVIERYDGGNGERRYVIAQDMGKTYQQISAIINKDKKQKPKHWPHSPSR